ncbi:MAG: hypothetical protein NTW06_03705 [Candidatus Falkowbacteria bacterium]|nr:hypothetical protein [Candidatus Falkowbacteria bacterium]
MHLQLLIQTYGYFAILAGTFLEGDIILAIGGFLAHQEYLSLPLVILAGFGGAFISDQFFFWLGRKKGGALLKKITRWCFPFCLRLPHDHAFYFRQQPYQIINFCIIKSSWRFALGNDC